MHNEKIIILGAGLAGLSAAYHLGKLANYEIFEKEQRIGGLCRSKHIDGFTFDCDAHLLHFKNSYTLTLLKDLMNSGLVEHQRDAWIRSFGVNTRYPFQANSFGLPPKINKECILGLVRAEYEKTEQDIANGASFEHWINRTFGEGIARHFMLPYNAKFWTVPPRELTCEWIDGYIPVPSLEEAIEGAVTENKRKFGYNAFFWYPAEGGIEQVPQALSRRIKTVHTRCAAIQVDIKRKEVSFEDGRAQRFEQLISTIALPELCKLINPLPAKVISACQKLRYTSIFNLNLGIDRDNLSDKHWIYFPEEEFIFYRVGFPHNFSFSLAPAGKSSIYVEVSYSKVKPINKQGIVQQIIEDLTKAQLLSEKDRILTQDINDIKYGYIIYDRDYHQGLQTILQFLGEHGIFSIGRYGRWKYMSMEDAILDGKQIIQVLQRVSSC